MRTIKARTEIAAIVATFDVDAIITIAEPRQSDHARVKHSCPVGLRVNLKDYVITPVGNGLT